MVHFQHFDVEVFAEGLGGLAHQGGKDVHAETHVARLHDARRLSGGADFFIACRIDAGGADDMDDARLARKIPPATASLPAR